LSTRTLYTDSFREQALEKVYNRGDASIVSVAEQLGLNPWTLKNWMKSRRTKSGKPRTAQSDSGVRSNEHSAAERMQLLLDSHGLDEQALGAFCRHHGIFTHQLEHWREAFESAAGAPPAAHQQVRELKQTQATLERELRRKDKALAEAAALLVLQKKFHALWEDKGE